jgi:hypothetical protein
MRISALLLVVMLALVASRMPNAMAQDASPDESAGAFDDLTQLEGIEQGVSRAYSVDYEALFASPSADAEFEMPTGIQMISGVILKFDSEDNAKAARDKANEELKSQTSEELGLEEFEVEGLNDDTIGLHGVEEDETLGSTQSSVIMTQEGEYLYLVFSIGTGSEEEVDTRSSAIDFVKHVVDADAGDGEGTFNADGTSEGGLWDKFPDADDDMVKDLVPADEQVYPETETSEE